MTMNRILEFQPSQEEAVVSRVLVLLHQAVDDYFPHAGQANRQFTKTQFSDDQGPGSLHPNHVDTDPRGSAAGAFAHIEDTSPGERPTERPAAPASSNPLAVPPPPPPRPASAASRALAAATAAAAQVAELPAASAKGVAAAAAPPSVPRSGHTRPTHLDTAMEGLTGGGPDWVSRITLVLLIAGLGLLAYLLWG